MRLGRHLQRVATRHCPQLRDRKLGHLNEMQPSAILSANIGCITHLQSGTAVPVRHWVEMVDAALARS